jgi:hypothetical protein
MNEYVTNFHSKIFFYYYLNKLNKLIISYIIVILFGLIFLLLLNRDVAISQSFHCKEEEYDEHQHKAKSNSELEVRVHSLEEAHVDISVLVVSEFLLVFLLSLLFFLLLFLSSLGNSVLGELASGLNKRGDLVLQSREDFLEFGGVLDESGSIRVVPPVEVVDVEDLGIVLGVGGDFLGLASADEVGGLDQTHGVVAVKQSLVGPLPDQVVGVGLLVLEGASHFAEVVLVVLQSGSDEEDAGFGLGAAIEVGVGNAPGDCEHADQSGEEGDCHGFEVFH